MDRLLRSALLIVLMVLGTIAGEDARLTRSMSKLKPPKTANALFALLHPEQQTIPPPPPPPPPLYVTGDEQAFP